MERFTKKLEDGRNIIENGITLVTSPKYRRRFFEGEAVDKLAEYEDLDEKGLLLRLPCKVGDTVYSVSFEKKCSETKENGGYLINQDIDCAFCENEDCKSKTEWFVEEIPATLPIIGNIIYCKNNEFNDFTIYSTREQAEKKLKELQKEGADNGQIS